MRPLGVVEAGLLGDEAFGYEAVRQFVQVDGLVFRLHVRRGPGRGAGRHAGAHVIQPRADSMNTES